MIPTDREALIAKLERFHLLTVSEQHQVAGQVLALLRTPEPQETPAHCPHCFKARNYLHDKSCPNYRHNVPVGWDTPGLADHRHQWVFFCDIDELCVNLMYCTVKDCHATTTAQQYRHQNWKK